MTRPLATLAAALLAAFARAEGAPAEARGTFRLQGTVQLSAGPALDRRLELHADAVLEPGPAPGQLRVRIVAAGHACQLGARRDAAGALAFDPGQRCLIALDDPDARGRIDATLRRGSGRLTGEHLTLELEGDLHGTIRLRAGGGQLLGTELPTTWLPETPVDGKAVAAAAGDRDRSRAAAHQRGP